MDIVLHVAYKVFMNVILQQGQEIVMADKDLKGKVVLVTGAARRIGAAIVTRLHDNGAAVAIPYRGYWFYIDDRDVRSKRTFAIVQIVLSLTDSGETARGPVVSITN